MTKGKNFTIYGATPVADNEVVGYTNPSDSTNDILFITGLASDPDNGITQSTDIKDKPDNNDFWVFNPNDFDLNITLQSGIPARFPPLYNSPTIIPAQSIGLLDFNGTAQLRSANDWQPIRYILIRRLDSTVTLSRTVAWNVIK